MAHAQPYLPRVGLLPIIPLRPELGIITHKLERSEAPVPWPAEEQEDENPHLCPSEEKSALHVYIYKAITLVAITIVSALLVWVRRRHPARLHRGSDVWYVAIRFPPRRRSLSRPHTPCVRLEHSLEGLRKSPLTVDSHTVVGLVVPVAN
ncbi:hypothetical protein Taro_019173 [Colocasia esculenta]|uniref:Uncharacterized protein n=1 Tax=Colocasia esculenta TaxID=4460 RepID=A0A843UW06_COLES|nr:hypothetical protein [Colocasia esculenta]